MITTSLVPVVAGIVLEGMEAWNEGRKSRFAKKYFKVIQRVKDAENAQYGIYTDAELMLAKEEEDTFLQAYFVELKAHNKEIKKK